VEKHIYMINEHLEVYGRQPTLPFSSSMPQYRRYIKHQQKIMGNCLALLARQRAQTAVVVFSTATIDGSAVRADMFPSRPRGGGWEHVLHHFSGSAM
jgi:hypothetical protein